jgi:hypothetical protein
MTGCVLRAHNDRADFEKLLSRSTFDEAVIHKGGFNFVISVSGLFDVQLRECEEFINNHLEECKLLVETLRPVAADLDFGIWKNEGPVQSVTFPQSLVKLAGRMGFRLTTSLYEANDL